MGNIILNNTSPNKLIIGAFDPTKVSGLILWYDGDYEGNTIDPTTSDTFAEIVDRSSSNNDALQGTKVNQPDVVTVADRKFWQTTSANSQFMDLTDGNFMADLGTWTFIQVFDNTTIQNIALILTNDSYNYTYYYLTSRPDSASNNYGIQFTMRDQEVGGWNNHLHGTTDCRNRKFVQSGRCNGSAYDCRLDGVNDPLIVDLGANDGKSFDDLGGGRVFNAANLARFERPSLGYNSSKVGDMLMYNRNLSDDELSSVENYLMTKHSI